MGNSTAKSIKDVKYSEEESETEIIDTKPPYDRLSRSIHRFFNYVCDDLHDVETLQIPFPVARDIFLKLSLADLHNCMLVCKEWRSLVDTCSFWHDYLYTNFDFSVVKHKSALLNLWNGLLKPVPDIWACEIVVPHKLQPGYGCLEVYHSFISALLWLQQLRKQILNVKSTGTIMVPMEVCLVPWYNDRMPTSKEVVSIFGGCRKLVSCAREAKPLTKQEMRNYFSIMNGKYTSKFDLALYRWMADRVKDKVILFDCNHEIVNPAPSFILTRLSNGWIGGLMYAS